MKRRKSPGRAEPEAARETWRSAFLKQARSDFDTLVLLNREKQPECHQLHYLQMATEKLAKAFLCSPPDRNPPPRSHKVFVRFLRHAVSIPELRRACGMGLAQFRALVQEFLPLAEKIQNLVPDAGNHPNVEYPWETKTGITAPLDHSYPSLAWHEPGIRKLRNFLERCLGLA